MTDLAHPDRLAKLERMRAEGLEPYPARGVVATPVEQLHALAGTPEEPGPGIGQTFTVAGRLMGLRDFGKLIFAPVDDRTGRLQVGLQKQRLADWWPHRKLLDGGDQVGITGELGLTQKGEPTIWATEVRILTKSVAPPPEKWHGLADVEQRYRRRYVDLFASAGVREVFVQRARIASFIRRYLEDQGYLEVETPTLHPISGGATARPFDTHHNALDMTLYLRIAPELYLKRLIVGGLERVFEWSRNFRNEGISVRHNPEFTMLELYEAQADYRRMMEIFEQLLEGLALALHGTTEVEFRGRTYDLKAPLPRAKYMDLFAEHVGCDFHDRESVLAKAREAKLDTSDAGHSAADYYKLANDVYEHFVDPHLDGPVFVIDYPIEISPLAKASADDPTIAERLELFVGGMELGNGFSELNDPAEQQRRFEEQVAAKDPESPAEVDIDYVQALEYGMPPTAGLGIGIDRLVMILTNQDSIRDVLLFPTMRPQQGQPSGDDAGADGPGASRSAVDVSAGS
ncbi:lysine--tRNA ligase [Engelhardtia mirabilis]|uniref:Lysine--tRNA ligase n=1 Tax=Engelhardtia mirabilis TaxID=2528011 RepID=A0A518BJY0_9BACT|nr:Lysine--tRNA ligase [Planctomycetes bacterium Pla133]QDV01579.1 Lysine--tRNA ligase [Planctomycetes bacterium Pla86]